jgi:hypothetical protein
MKMNSKKGKFYTAGKFAEKDNAKIFHLGGQ